MCCRRVSRESVKLHPNGSSPACIELLAAMERVPLCLERVLCIRVLSSRYGGFHLFGFPHALTAACFPIDLGGFATGLHQCYGVGIRDFYYGGIFGHDRACIDLLAVTGGPLS